MARPSKEELVIALQYAETIREQNNDPEHVAKALLFLHTKSTLLDKLFHAADAYVNHGGFPQQHAELAHAVNEIKRLETTERQSNKTGIGLG